MRPDALFYLVAIAAVILAARALAQRRALAEPMYPPPILPVSDYVQIPDRPFHIPGVQL